MVRVGCTPKGEWGVDAGVVRVGCTPEGECGGGEGGMHAQGGVGSIHRTKGEVDS